MPFYRPARPEPAVLRHIGDIIDLAVMVLGTIMIALMFINVLARAALQVDVAANVELGEFMLVWATFLGCAAAARRSAHMRITELIDAAPVRLRQLMELGTRVGVLAILASLVWNGFLIAHQNMEQQTSVLYWPVGLTYAALPVGAAFTFLFVCWETWRIAHGEQITDTSHI